MLEDLGANFSGSMSNKMSAKHKYAITCSKVNVIGDIFMFLPFRLAMQEITECSGLLEGSEGHMVFTHNLKLLEDNKYYLAGRLVGMSIIHGGPGLSCLDPVTYKLMCGLPCCLNDFDISVITDSDIAETLREVCLLLVLLFVNFKI